MKKKNKKPASYEAVKKPAAKQQTAAEPEQTAPIQPEQPAPAAALRPAKLTMEERYPMILFGVMLFFAMTLQTGRMAVLLPVLAFCVLLRKRSRENFRQNLSIPLLGLLGFAVMTGLGAIYTSFGDSGAAELYKMMASFSVAVVFLCVAEKKHTRSLLCIVAIVCSIISLVSVDGAGGGFLFDAFHGVIRALGGSYANATLLTAGPRVNGIYNDANITANIFGMSSLISLYLMRTEEEKKKRLLLSLLLGISAMGFFLSMSRAAILFFAVSLLVWMIAEPRKNRIGLLLSMVWCAVVVVGFSIPSMMTIDETALPAVGLSLLAGPAIWLLDEMVGRRLSAILETHTRAAVAMVLVLVLAAGGYVAAAVTVQGPYELAAGEDMWRSVELEAGSYQVLVEADGEVNVHVRIQNTLQHVNNVGDDLYSGNVAGAKFTVPQERAGQRVNIHLTAEDGATVTALSLSNGEKIPLNYPLLPLSVANRLHEGLLSGNSAILRAQFAKDALALFLQSPIYGHGMGSTENLYTTVQPYFYQSLFAHSHVLQVMSDLGLLGTIPFLMLLLGSLWLILKQVRKREDAMASMLLGVWTMMNAHSMLEINFSIRSYQCMAWILLLLPVLAYGQALSVKKLKQWGAAAVCVTGAFLLVFTGLVASRRATQRAANNLQAYSADEFMMAMKSYTNRDVFDHEQYQLNFVANAIQFTDGRYSDTMLDYVADLRNSGTYGGCSGLARHYYLPLGQIREMFEVSRMAIAQEAANKDAWNYQMNFYREDVLHAVDPVQAQIYLDGVNGVLDWKEEFDGSRMESIELTQENQMFADAVREVTASGTSAQQMLETLREQFPAPEQEK